MIPCCCIYVFTKKLFQEVDETTSDLPKSGKCELLNICEDPFCEGYGVFEKGVCLSIFYCLCFVEDISENIAEKQVTEETDLDLEGGEDFRIYNG